MDKLIIFGIVVIIGVLIVGSYHEHKEWEAFKVAHACKIVAQVSASTGSGPVVGTDGKVGIGFVTVPGKTGWQCDDGVTYYR